MWSRCMILSDTQDVIANVIVGECLGDIKVHWCCHLFSWHPLLPSKLFVYQIM